MEKDLVSSNPPAFFDKREYDRYLQEDPDAAAVATALAPFCNFQVLVNIVRNSLPRYADRHYKHIRAERNRDIRKIEKRIPLVQELAEHARHTEQDAAAVFFESGVAHHREKLREIKSESTKSLGTWKTKALPFAPMYIVCLEEYISAKTGKKPKPTELKHIFSALLQGFREYPDSGVDADLLAKKCKRFRQRQENRDYIGIIEQNTKCDPSGQTELDRILSKSAPKDRL